MAHMIIEPLPLAPLPELLFAAMYTSLTPCAGGSYETKAPDISNRLITIAKFPVLVRRFGFDENKKFLNSRFD